MSKYNLCTNGHYYENTLQKCPYCPDAGQNDFNKTQIIQNIPSNVLSNIPNNDDDKTQLIEKQDFNKTAIFSGNIEQNQQIVAEMTYVWAGDAKIIIDHTEVDESLNGKGIGKQMVEKLFA